MADLLNVLSRRTVLQGNIKQILVAVYILDHTIPDPKIIKRVLEVEILSNGVEEDVLVVVDGHLLEVLDQFVAP